MKRRFLMLALLAGAAGAFGAGEPELGQSVTLYPGWNAFFLKGTPAETADELFADWPVESVGRYDASAYARTLQYTATASTEGATPQSVLLWRKGLPAASQWTALLANAVYLAFSTNQTAFTRTVYGVPEAARLSWHPSSDTTLNYVGFSLDATGAAVRQRVYFAGFPGWKDVGHPVVGDTPERQELGYVFESDTFGDGDALAMGSSAVSDWSGPLYVSPQYGLAFGTNGVKGSVSCRNDHATNLTVRVALTHGAAGRGGTGFPPVTTNFWIRENVAVGERAAWRPFLPSAPFERELAPGETLSLQLALDRAPLASVAAGTLVGGLLTFTDLSAGTHFQTAIPVSALCDGGASAATAWPNGLWLAEVAFDAVSYFQAGADVTDPVPAGGTMKVRLPLYVAGDGVMTLRPRVDLGGRRLTSVFLPSDLEPNYIVSSHGTFGTEAAFAFTVKEDARSNPFRHPLHPQHDGLDATFAAKAPSGDVAANYLGGVKPELFSIDNTVTFVWNEGGQVVSWNPQEKLTGTCTWRFGRVRREADVVARGTFTMTRVSTVALSSPAKQEDDADSGTPEAKE